MYKFSLSKCFMKLLILVYIILYCFNGVFVAISMRTSLIEIKRILPELILVLVIILIIFNMVKEGKIKYNKTIMIAFFYYTTIAIICMHNIQSFQQFSYAIRDMWLPFSILLLLFSIRFNEYDTWDLLHKIDCIFTIAIICGCILAIFEIINGWDWTSTFYTGYRFYGIDVKSNIKINSSMGVIRPPSITGDSTAFGLLSVFAAFIFSLNKKKNLIYYSRNLICILNVFLSTSRTSILMLAIYYIISIKDAKKKIFIALLFVFSTLSIICFSKGQILEMLTSSYSLIDRIKNAWTPLFSYINPKDFLFGKNIYSIGAIVRIMQDYEHMLVLGVFDNTFLCMFATYGVFGLTLFVVLIRRMLKINKNIFFKALTYSFIFGGLFANMFQARIFFIIYVILFCVLDVNIFNKNKLLEII